MDISDKLHAPVSLLAIINSLVPFEKEFGETDGRLDVSE
jgi:hypothetical protein